MSKAMARIQHLNVFLAQERCKQFKEVLREPSLVSEFVIVKKRGFEAGLYVPDAPTKEPAWVEFLKEGFGNQVAVRANKISSALMLIRVRSRVFAFTFGHARSLLKEECLELDFGLMVAVNRVDARRIRGIGLRMFREMTLKRLEEAAQGTDLQSFTLNMRQDLLRTVTGRPRDFRFASRVSGSDSLVIDAPLSFSELGNKCEEMLRAYHEKEYLRQGFRWIKNIKEVRDSEKVAELYGTLIAALQARSKDVQLMMPDSYARGGIKGFMYPGEKDETAIHPELEIEEWYRASESWLEELRPEEFTRRHIRMVDEAGDVDRVQEYQFFLFEVKGKDGSFILSNGRWYEIARGLLNEIDEFVEQIEGTALPLMPAVRGEVEDKYLSRLVKRREDLALMHKATLQMPGGQIELCDIISRKGHLIHVKRWSASSTFSHLLRQGAVSADAIRNIASVRKHIRTHVRRFKGEVARMFPAHKFSTSGICVVFALIRDSDKDLPFFSKLSLMREAQQIQSWGYKVVYQRIEVTPGQSS